jgi:copper homeostasis protein
MTPNAAHLEICVDSLAGARAALAGGADAIELCSALGVGGLTPSPGLTEAVLALPRRAGVTIRAMVRPRPGGFDYVHDELAVAIADGRALLAAGVDGLVFGATRNGGLDDAAIRGWRDALGPRPIGLTLHRAIDLLADPAAAVEQAIALGFDQILSSGGAPTAWDGRATVARMVAVSGARCRIIAGSGVKPDLVVPLLAETGATAIHASARAATAPAHDVFGFGIASPPADEAVVSALRAALDAAVSG